jgi:hypothetical protein
MLIFVFFLCFVYKVLSFTSVGSFGSVSFLKAEISGPEHDLVEDVLSEAAKTSRGQRGDIKPVTKIIEDLESLNIVNRDALEGKWELVFANDDVTRSSPFFWAFRQSLEEFKDPNPLMKGNTIAESLFLVTDSIPFRTIGDAYQIFTGEDMRSEVTVDLQAAGQSIMTTRSTWQWFQDRFLEVTVATTAVEQSTLGQFLPLMDGAFRFPSGASLELVKPGSSTVLAEQTYLDETLRVVRVQDKVFVYKKRE